MAKFSQKQGGKEVGQAAVYAEPHTMDGKKVNTKETISVARDPNTLSAREVKPGKPAMRVSMGDPNADDVKTSGIKIRGTGAATKGVMARGPMG
jgi:uncharacterized protein (DUF2141 family)